MDFYEMRDDTIVDVRFQPVQSSARKQKLDLKIKITKSDVFKRNGSLTAVRSPFSSTWGIQEDSLRLEGFVKVLSRE